MPNQHCRIDNNISRILQQYSYNDLEQLAMMAYFVNIHRLKILIQEKNFIPFVTSCCSIICSTYVSNSISILITHPAYPLHSGDVKCKAHPILAGGKVANTEV